MRLWHKDLIPALPRNQLLGQWRECCLIAKGLNEGTLNHLLVNKVKEYPVTHFALYCNEVKREIERRGYKTNTKINFLFGGEKILPTHEGLFREWHNDRYLTQCLYNLQEKYDCGGLTEDEWQLVENRYWAVYSNEINKAREIR